MLHSQKASNVDVGPMNMQHILGILISPSDDLVKYMGGLL